MYFECLNWLVCHRCKHRHLCGIGFLPQQFRTQHLTPLRSRPMQRGPIIAATMHGLNGNCFTGTLRVTVGSTESTVGTPILSLWLMGFTNQLKTWATPLVLILVQTCGGKLCNSHELPGPASHNSPQLPRLQR